MLRQSASNASRVVSSIFVPLRTLVSMAGPLMLGRSPLGGRAPMGSGFVSTPRFRQGMTTGVDQRRPCVSGTVSHQVPPTPLLEP